MQSYLFKGVCYPDVMQARQAVCASASHVWGEGSSLMTANCAESNFSGSAYRICKRVDAGACQMIEVPYPDFQPCSHSGGFDFAAQWFWLALPLFVTVFYFRRALGLFSEEK